MGKSQSPWKSYRIRMPWILCNMAGGLACAVISFFYQEVLAKVLLLAMFIPLILTLSESITMQSMTQSLHLVRQPEITWRRIFNRILIQGKMVIWLGLTCGIAVGIISLFWGGGIRPSITIATSLFISISLSASAGASVPLLLHSRSWDPKVASGPVVLMFADVINNDPLTYPLPLGGCCRVCPQIDASPTPSANLWGSLKKIFDRKFRKTRGWP